MKKSKELEHEGAYKISNLVRAYKLDVTKTEEQWLEYLKNKLDPIKFNVRIYGGSIAIVTDRAYAPPFYSAVIEELEKCMNR